MLLQWVFRGLPGLSAVYLQASSEIVDDQQLLHKIQAPRCDCIISDSAD